MPRPGGMKVEEKAKDFKGSMKRLFQNLDRFKKLFVLALFLAFLSSIFSTIAPKRLARITDIISAGMKPDTVVLEEITKQIYSSVMMKYPNLTGKVSLTEEELREALEPFTIKNVEISVEDQLSFLRVFKEYPKEKDMDSLLANMDLLPKTIKDLTYPKLDLELLKIRVLGLAILYLLCSLFGYLQERIMAIISNGYAKKLRRDISHKINQLPLAYFDKHETGDVLSRITNDVDSIGMNLNQSVASFVSNITLFIGSIVMMFVTNWMMAFTAIFSSLFGFFFSFLLLKNSQKYFSRRQKELGNLNGHIEEIYSGHNVVKTYNGEKEALKEFDTINDRLYECNRKSQFLSGIMHPVMAFIGNFGYVMVCIVGAILVMKGYTTFGVIVAFMIYIRLFTNPLSQIAQAMTAMQSVAAAVERVFEFMDEEELSSEENIDGYIDHHKAKGNILFQDVKFGYDKDHMIIKDFNAEVHAGEKIAIVGPTGAGKTTMVNLLMKFYEIHSGDILIDGKSIHQLKRDNIHNLFVMVLQDTWLFEGTIRDNIKFNQKNISDEEIWKVCKTVGIDHFIKTLPGGLDSIVGDNDMISSGQKQLLTIARGMMEDAPFLILDEATSNVDTRTEELVQKAMDKLMEGRTSFIIAHRLSTIKNADLILVMDEGNIVEQGSHEELLSKNGFYAKLYNSQFQK